MSTPPPVTGARILDPQEFYHSGVTAFFASRDDQRFSYCLYVPAAHITTTRKLPLVVLVHGTNRLAERSRTAFREFAEEHACVVMAPLFPAGIIEPGDLHGYKRIRYHDIRFDHVLLRMIDEVGERYKVDTERFMLHGFSGGGQFSHRFAYLHPQRLSGLSVGAPGRVTRIDADTPWWQGTADLREQFGTDLDLAALREVPTQMIVGAQDTETWEISEPDIDAGGATRVERLGTLRDNWVRHGVDVTFDLIPGMAHKPAEALPHVASYFSGLLKG